MVNVSGVVGDVGEEQLVENATVASIMATRMAFRMVRMRLAGSMPVAAVQSDGHCQCLRLRRMGRHQVSAGSQMSSAARIANARYRGGVVLRSFTGLVSAVLVLSLVALG